MEYSNRRKFFHGMVFFQGNFGYKKSDVVMASKTCFCWGEVVPPGIVYSLSHRGVATPGGDPRGKIARDLDRGQQNPWNQFQSHRPLADEIWDIKKPLKPLTVESPHDGDRQFLLLRVIRAPLISSPVLFLDSPEHPNPPPCAARYVICSSCLFTIPSPEP